MNFGGYCPDCLLKMVWEIDEEIYFCNSCERYHRKGIGWQEAQYKEMRKDEKN